MDGKIILSVLLIGADDQSSHLSTPNRATSDRPSRSSRQVVDIQRRVSGPKHPDTLESISNLAGFLRDTGKYAQAEALCSETLEIRRRVLGSEDRSTLLSMYCLAYAYYVQGKWSQAGVQCFRVYTSAICLPSDTLEIRERCSIRPREAGPPTSSILTESPGLRLAK